MRDFLVRQLKKILTLWILYNLILLSFPCQWFNSGKRNRKRTKRANLFSIKNQLGKFNELTKAQQFIALYKLKTN